MTKFIAIFIFVLSSPLFADDFMGSGSSTGPNAKGVNYNLVPEIQLGYPTVKLKNPDGRSALYDGIAVRAILNIPLLRGQKYGVYLNPGLKYLDLQNRANSSTQHESANLTGIGAGLAVRYRNVWAGARYMHMWGRHYTSGAFGDRADYQLTPIEYNGGYYHQFDRLGLGLTYSRTMSKISNSYTHLEADTPYDETVYSIQVTFDIGTSLWGILTSIF